MWSNAICTQKEILWSHNPAIKHSMISKWHVVAKLQYAINKTAWTCLPTRAVASIIKAEEVIGRFRTHNKTRLPFEIHSITERVYTWFNRMNGMQYAITKTTNQLSRHRKWLKDWNSQNKTEPPLRYYINNQVSQTPRAVEKVSRLGRSHWIT